MAFNETDSTCFGAQKGLWVSESGAVSGRVRLKLSWQPDTFHDFLQRLPQEAEKYTVEASFIPVYILRPAHL